MARTGTGPGARRRAADARRVAVVSAAIVVALVLAPAALAKAKPKPPRHGADLIITNVTLDAGTPSYIVADTRGHLSDFTVDVPQVAATAHARAG